MASNNWGFKLPSNYVNRYRWSSPKKSLGNYKWIPIKIKGKKMRISEQALEQIIKEEVQTALLELAPLPGAVSMPGAEKKKPGGEKKKAGPGLKDKVPTTKDQPGGGRPVPKWYLDSWKAAGSPPHGSNKWRMWFRTQRSIDRAAVGNPEQNHPMAKVDYKSLRKSTDTAEKKKPAADPKAAYDRCMQQCRVKLAGYVCAGKCKARVAAGKKSDADPKAMARKLGGAEAAAEFSARQQAVKKAAPTGVELFGRGARCPKCTYAKEGGKYYITAPSGKKVRASRRQTRQLVKALRRRK